MHVLVRVHVCTSMCTCVYVHVCVYVCVCVCIHACVWLPQDGAQVDGSVLLGLFAPGGPCLSPAPYGSVCRFSHGQVVPLDELRPFQDPDLSSLQAGSACLAKHQDGLWHAARITGEAGRGGLPGTPSQAPHVLLLRGCSLPPLG